MDPTGDDEPDGQSGDSQPPSASEDDGAAAVHQRLEGGDGGPDGNGPPRNRSLWGRAIGMVGVTFAASFVGALLYSPPRPGETVSDVVVELVIASEIGFVVVGAAMLAGASFEGELGLGTLPDRRTALRDVLGTGIGLAAISVTVVGLLASSGEAATPLVGADPSAEAEIANVLASLIPLSILVVAPAEELFFRGVIQRHLRLSAGPQPAIVVAALIFTGAHLPQYLGLDSGLAMVLMLGVIFAVGYAAGRVYERTGSLPAAIGVHATYNCTIATVWYLEVTRGVLPI